MYKGQKSRTRLGQEELKNEEVFEGEEGKQVSSLEDQRPPYPLIQHGPDWFYHLLGQQCKLLWNVCINNIFFLIFNVQDKIQFSSLTNQMKADKVSIKPR